MLRTRTRKGPEMSDEEEGASRRMRAAFKCANCDETVMLPNQGLAEVENEDEVVHPVKAVCAAGRRMTVTPPSGYKFVRSGDKMESVRTFFNKYLRETSRQQSDGFMG